MHTANAYVYSSRHLVTAPGLGQSWLGVGWRGFLQEDATLDIEAAPRLPRESLRAVEEMPVSLLRAPRPT